MRWQGPTTRRIKPRSVLWSLDGSPNPYNGCGYASAASLSDGESIVENADGGRRIREGIHRWCAGSVHSHTDRLGISVENDSALDGVESI